MMAAVDVRFKGLRELDRALGKVNKEAQRTVRNAIKEAVEPVASSAREKLARYPGASIGTIGPRVAARGAFVTQRKRKVTGAHPEFGVLTMERVLEPSLEESSGEVLHDIERALDRLGDSAGF